MTSKYFMRPNVETYTQPDWDILKVATMGTVKATHWLNSRWTVVELILLK